MGWERSILPQLVELIDRFPEYEKFPPIDRNEKLAFGLNRKDVKDLSPNHWELGISSELLRSAAHGLRSDWIIARDVYLHALGLHLNKIGLWTTEQFTGAPHGGFYLNALVAARMAVWIRKEQGKFDPDLEEPLDEYTRRVLSYLHSCSTPLGEVVCCGERMPKGPDAPQQSIFYRELCGLKHPNAKKINKQIEDDFWLSLRGLRKLLEVKDSIKIIMEVVKSSPLSLPLTSQAIILEKWTTGHIARYTSTGGDGTCRWVWVDKEKVKWGTDTGQCPNPIKPFQMLIGTIRPKEVSVSVKENEFSVSSLWPKSNHNWMHPSALGSTSAQYGNGLDLGALRVNPQSRNWEILISKIPTKGSPANSEWVDFNPNSNEHLLNASAFNRYGPGWSFGPAHGLHDEARGLFEELNGRDPSPMEKLDIEHDRGLWAKLKADHAAKFPQLVEPDKKPDPVKPAPKPIEPKPIPVEPKPIEPKDASLSSIEKRSAELLSLIPLWARLAIGDVFLLPIIKEAIQAKRRSEERIIRGVIEGLKK